MNGQSSRYKGIECAIFGQCTKVTVKLPEKSLPESSAVEASELYFLTWGRSRVERQACRIHLNAQGE
jgi:hypothetical protein